MLNRKGKPSRMKFVGSGSKARKRSRNLTHSAQPRAGTTNGNSKDSSELSDDEKNNRINDGGPGNIAQFAS